MNKKVYVIQELPGTRMGTPKFNIMGASKYGDLITLLPENSQIIMSPGPLISKRLYRGRLLIAYRRSCHNWCGLFYSFRHYNR